MSDEMKIDLQQIGVAVGILAAISALFGAYVLLPHRMEAAERAIQTLEAESRVNRELLVRIDENVKELKSKHARAQE